MIQRSIAVAACVVLALPAARVHAQDATQPQTVAGVYEFKESVASSPTGAGRRESIMRLTVTINGDSALALSQLVIPNMTTRVDTLRGTVKGNTLTLASRPHQQKLRMSIGEDRVVDIYDQYVLTVTGDDIAGEATPVTSDPALQMFARPMTGRRAAGGQPLGR